MYAILMVLGYDSLQSNTESEEKLTSATLKKTYCSKVTHLTKA